MDDIIGKHGGYRKLRSFQSAQRIYDLTVLFCDRFVDRYSRTRDQMIQAARSGTQNIAEGSLASGTSKKTELKLTGVARASLGELLLDYEDYLRQHGLQQWAKDDPRALALRRRLASASDRSDRARVSDKSDWSDRSDKKDLSEFRKMAAEEYCNTLLCLINQTSYLLWRQMQRLERDFIETGGFGERLYRSRKGYRDKKSRES